MINELDRVALTAALPEYRLTEGDIGTVVLVHQGGRGYSVEFMTFDGETIAVVTLDAAMVRPLRHKEISHARAVA